MAAPGGRFDPQPLFDGASLFDAELLRARTESSVVKLLRLLANAEYWLSFDVARFEPLLAHVPSPLRELGVGILLGFGESPNGKLDEGKLEEGDLRTAARALERLPADLKSALDTAIEVLLRGIKARERTLVWEQQEGFRPVASRSGVSPFALRAAGTASIIVEGHPPGNLSKVPLGEPLRISADDERGRPLPPPDVESKLGAPIWLQESSSLGRRIVLAVPGVYVLQVPGRARGARTLVAR